MKKYGVRKPDTYSKWYIFVPDLSWRATEYYDTDKRFGTDDINIAYQFKAAFENGKDAQFHPNMEVFERELEQ